MLGRAEERITALHAALVRDFVRREGLTKALLPTGYPSSASPPCSHPASATTAATRSEYDPLRKADQRPCSISIPLTLA